MAANSTTGLTFICDENLGGIPAILKLARVRPVGHIISMREAGVAGGANDADWIAELGKGQNRVVLTRDSAILNVAVQSAAWLRSGLRLFLLARGWGQMPAPELARAVLYWWPEIVAYADNSAPGTAWIVSSKLPDHPAGGIRPVTGSAPPPS